MDFNVELSDGNGAVIRGKGRLDMASATRFRDLVVHIVRQDGRSHVTVDLADTDFIDSSGLGALVSGLKTARAAGGDLKIARAQAMVLTVLHLTNLDQVLYPFTTVEECFQ